MCNIGIEIKNIKSNLIVNPLDVKCNDCQNLIKKMLVVTCMNEGVIFYWMCDDCANYFIDHQKEFVICECSLK